MNWETRPAPGMQCEFCGQQSAAGYAPPHSIGACPFAHAEHLLRMKILEAELAEAVARKLLAEREAHGQRA